MKNLPLLRKNSGLAGLAALLASVGACKPEASTGGAAASSPAAQAVVVYTSVDEEFARQVLGEFERRSGIRVDAVYDSEAGKTTGFLRRIEREASRPRCDVWWSSEVFGTIELARGGLLERYEPPAASDIPDGWKDPNGHWTGLAARARVIGYHTQRVRAEDVPKTWRAFVDAAAAKRLAVANPQFGTTRGHVAALFAAGGPIDGRKLLQSLRDGGARLADGNAHAVRMLAAGEADLCWTDTDDVWSARRRGEPIELVYPRIDEGGPVVWIPCSVAIVRGGPNAATARKLADFLVSAEAERMLHDSDSKNVPLRAALREQLRPHGPPPEPLAWERVADALPKAMEAAREVLLR